MRWGRKPKKIFVIGRNKTGTTSMAQALVTLGFHVGDQATAELLIEDWSRRDFRALIRYCATADAFQDVPFSLDYTYQALDAAFPGSKFILTVRNSSQEWYESWTRFITQLVGLNHLPSADELKLFTYRDREPGWLWRSDQMVLNVDESTLYNREVYTRHYEAHNQRVCDYFRYRPESLLVLNLAAPDAMQALCRFLDVKPVDWAMPHLNRSKP